MFASCFVAWMRGGAMTGRLRSTFDASREVPASRAVVRAGRLGATVRRFRCGKHPNIVSQWRAGCLPGSDGEGFRYDAGSLSVSGFGW